MNIDRNFIEQVVDSFHDALTARDDLCKTCQAEYHIEFYKKKAYQELYALRFLPAYYFEYCVLAEELYNRVKDDYEHLKILSLGCGLSPDYYAFNDNLGSIGFTYVGYDAVEWTSQRYMPKTGNNHRFVFRNIEKISEEVIADIDVFVFPKSIGDIENGSNGLIAAFGDKVAAVGKDRVFFLNSYVTRGFDNPVDKSLFKTIHNSLLQAGYSTKDDPNDSFYRNDGQTKNTPIGLRKLHYEFIYPEGRSIACNRIDLREDVCKECMVPKRPILTNQYMSFAALEYRKQ